MNYTFSKDLIDIGSRINSKKLRLYKIMSTEGMLCGQLLNYPTKQLIQLSSREIQIKTISKLFTNPKCILLDLNDNKEIGQLEIMGGFGVNFFWQDAPSDPIGRIKVGESVFNFRRIPPAISYSFFKQETWGHFKFRLYTIKGNDFYEYSFKLDMPVLDMGPALIYKTFTGSIETNGDNLLAILTAFYLIEAEFSNEDTRATSF